MKKILKSFFMCMFLFSGKMNSFPNVATSPPYQEENRLLEQAGMVTLVLNESSGELNDETNNFAKSVQTKLEEYLAILDKMHDYDLPDALDRTKGRLTISLGDLREARGLSRTPHRLQGRETRSLADLHPNRSLRTRKLSE